MLWWIGENAVVSGLLAAVVAAVCRLGRFSPAVKHALWLLILIKLVTPPIGWYRLPASFDAGLRLLTGHPAPLPPPAAERVDLVERSPSSGRPAAAVPSAGDLEVGDLEVEVLPTAAVRPPALPRPWRAGGLIVPAWLAGAAAFAAVQLVRLARLWRWVRQATPPPDWLGQLVRQAASRLNVAPPEVAVLPLPCSPMVCALGRPRLLWPAALGEQLTAQARQAVVLHELAHLRRRDHWVAWLELLAGVGWWFNPVYWYVRWQLRENAELACDAWVIGLLPAGRRTYAQALIDVTEFVSSAAAELPALAMGNVARTSLERRLTMILRERVSHRVSLIGAGLIGFTLLAVLPGWSRGQAPAAGTAAAPTGLAGAEVPAATTGVRDSGPADTAAGNSTPSDNTPSEAGRVAGAPANSNLAGGAPAIDSNLAGADVHDPVANRPGGGEEQRLAEVEARLSQLLAEVHALRARTAAEAQGALTRKPGVQKAGQPMPGGMVGRRVVAMGRFLPQARPNYVVAQADASIETLTRAKYKLPQSTSDALASFIEEHVKADVDVKVDGDTLTVIALQEDQARIAGFVELLRDQE